MSNNRRGGESRLLVSFCNVRNKREPVLAVVDVLRSPIEVEWLDIHEDIFVRGATGLCLMDGLVCVIYQREARTNLPGFVLLDPNQGFSKVVEGVLPSDSDPHSVCPRDGDLYVVLTRKDGVARVSADPSTGDFHHATYWTFPGSSGESDENHLNAIDLIDGELHVSGFGEKKFDQWTSATDGFVYNIDQGEYVLRGLHHPHSLLEDSGVAWTTESAESRVVSHSGDNFVFPAGYIRGLAIGDDRFYVGSSKRRVFSESTGEINRQSSGVFEGYCCIYSFERGSKTPELLADFSDTRNEIYEMLLV